MTKPTTFRYVAASCLP